MASRLDAMQFVLQVGGALRDASDELTIVRLACAALRADAQLRRVIACILAVGNKLNGTTARGYELKQSVFLNDEY